MIFLPSIFMGLSWKFGHAFKIEAFALLSLKRSSFGRFSGHENRRGKNWWLSLLQACLSPPPRAFVGHLSSCRSQWWGFVRKPLPGGGTFVNSARKCNYVDSFIKNIFDTYALKRYAWFSLHHFPTSQLFLHPSKKLLPLIVICSSWRENNHGNI